MLSKSGVYTCEGHATQVCDRPVENVTSKARVVIDTTNDARDHTAIRPSCPRSPSKMSDKTPGKGHVRVPSKESDSSLTTFLALRRLRSSSFEAAEDDFAAFFRGFAALLATAVTALSPSLVPTPSPSWLYSDLLLDRRWPLVFLGASASTAVARAFLRVAGCDGGRSMDTVMESSSAAFWLALLDFGRAMLTFAKISSKSFEMVASGQKCETGRQPQS